MARLYLVTGAGASGQHSGYELLSRGEKVRALF